MKARRGRAWVRWTLLGATVAVVLLMAISLWLDVQFDFPPSFNRAGVSGGRLWLRHVTGQSGDWRVNLWPHPFGERWSMGWEWSSFTTPLGAKSWGAFVPGWMLLAASATVSGWMLWRERRGAAPGRCQLCRYDRAGLPGSTPCPECGALPPRATG